MPIPRNAQSSAGATRLYDDNRSQSRAAPRTDARCPMCGQKNTVGRVNLQPAQHYCNQCNIEFNTKTGKMMWVKSNGKLKPVEGVVTCRQNQNSPTPSL